MIENLEKLIKLRLDYSEIENVTINVDLKSLKQLQEITIICYKIN